MKTSTLTLGLGILAAAGSVVIGASAEAATLSFASGPAISSSKAFEFQFLPPTDGSFKSKLFVTDSDKTTSYQDLFVEPLSNDGSANPNTVVTSGSWATGNGAFILGWGHAYTANQPQLGVNQGVPAYSVYSNDPLPNFKFLSVANGWYTYGIEDIIGGGDGDYNDGKFKVRPVPVPAIVPGIALAAAFFGSKALKRNKKKVEGSVA
jgi:hypothetical protein